MTAKIGGRARCGVYLGARAHGYTTAPHASLRDERHLQQLAGGAAALQLLIAGRGFAKLRLCLHPLRLGFSSQKSVVTCMAVPAGSSTLKSCVNKLLPWRSAWWPIVPRSFAIAVVCVQKERNGKQASG